MIARNRQYIPSVFVKGVIMCIFVVCIIFPLAHMLATVSIEDFVAVLHAPTFMNALLNSIVLSLMATLFSVSLAFVLAYCLSRTTVRLKKVWEIIFTLPMLIPSISHGMGLIILFGGNGIVKNLLQMNATIYGPVGIVVGSVLYSFPVAYIMFADVLKYEDASTYEAADVLGLGRAAQFFKITVPYMRKPIIATSFSVFSMIITDYGVPLMVGGRTKTIPLIMYEEVIGQLNFGRGCVYGIILLVPAIVAFLVDSLGKDKGAGTFVKREKEQGNRKLLTVFTYLLCVLVAVFVLLPIISFLILAVTKSYPRDLSLTVDNLLNTFKRNGLRYLLNSLQIALITSVIGVIFAYVSAYVTSRMQSGMSRCIHLLFLSSMAIPGIVLGLSYAIGFSDSFIYGTIAIVVMVNVVHFVSSPYILMCNSFRKMNDQLENVGATLGISRMRMILDVFIPQNIASIAEMFSYIFINCMITISAVSFLVNVSTKPISLLINQFEAQMQYECAAVVSLIILFINLMLKFGMEGLKIGKRRTGRRKAYVVDKKTV